MPSLTDAERKAFNAALEALPCTVEWDVDDMAEMYASAIAHERQRAVSVCRERVKSHRAGSHRELEAKACAKTIEQGEPL